MDAQVVLEILGKQALGVKEVVKVEVVSLETAV
jgi:hypothetical protein